LPILSRCWARKERILYSPELTGVGECFRHWQRRDFCQTNNNDCRHCWKPSTPPGLKYPFPSRNAQSLSKSPAELAHVGGARLLRNYCGVSTAAQHRSRELVANATTREESFRLSCCDRRHCGPSGLHCTRTPMGCSDASAKRKGSTAVNPGGPAELLLTGYASGAVGANPASGSIRNLYN